MTEKKTKVFAKLDYPKTASGRVCVELWSALKEGQTTTAPRFVKLFGGRHISQHFGV